MKTYGVILAAGDSTRFDAKVNKLFYKVNDKELVLYPVETFLDNNVIDEVLIVSSKSNKSALEKLLTEHQSCLLYTSPSPRDTERSRMPSSA